VLRNELPICALHTQEVAPFGVHAENERVFFGEAPLGLAKADYEQRLRTWEEWQPVAELAQG